MNQLSTEEIQDKINNLNIKRPIKFKKVCKLFYKKYPYKLVLNGRSEPLYTRTNFSRSFKKESIDTYSQIMLLLGDCFGANQSLNLLDSGTIRLYESTTANLFFENVKHFLKFVTLAKDKIASVEVIADHSIIDTIMDDEKTIIKKQYYFKKFPYRVELNRIKFEKHLVDQGILEFYGWQLFLKAREKLKSDQLKQKYFHDWFHDNVKDPYKNCKIRAKQNIPTFYFQNYDDLVLFKMSFPDLVEKIESVILLEDKKDA